MHSTKISAAITRTATVTLVTMTNVSAGLSYSAELTYPNDASIDIETLEATSDTLVFEFPLGAPGTYKALCSVIDATHHGHSDWVATATATL